MHGLQFRLQFRILPFQNPYPRIPPFSLAIEPIDDPQMVLVDLIGPAVLLQHPLGGHAPEGRAAMPVGAGKIRGRIRGPRHAYRCSRFRSSQFTLERAWSSVQSLAYRRPISTACGTRALRT